MLFQDIIARLEEFWKGKGCLIGVPYPGDIGAGTFNPLTFFTVLEKSPMRVAYVETSKRPKDGRYGKIPTVSRLFSSFRLYFCPHPPIYRIFTYLRFPLLD